ncbi:hypothetical protein SGPA1_10700 [Streptomyces misionensis JCM 4497]
MLRVGELRTCIARPWGANIRGWSSLGRTLRPSSTSSAGRVGGGQARVDARSVSALRRPVDGWPRNNLG